MKRKYKAIVTGGTRGIGYAIAKRLLKDGMEVIVTGTSKNAEYPDGASYQQVNFLSDNSMLHFTEYLKQQQVDILVNNAGINKIGEFASIAIEDFDQILRVK